MSPRTVAQTILAASALALALNAGAQTPTSGAAQPAAAKAATNTGAPSAASGQSEKSTTGKHHRHHAASHTAGNAQHKPMESARPASSQETAYQMALRHCVAGPTGQRDSCLDSAITRYGRS
jgi:hypothetical protein